MRKKLVLLLLATTGVLFMGANNPVMDYTYHSIYVYNFTKYIEWPTNTEEFRIHILGGDATILKIFENMAENKNVAGSKILVKQYFNLNSLPYCDILFIPQSHSHFANKALEKTKGTNTLVITEKNGLAETGSCINFVLVENKLKFEINKLAIDEAGLKVSSQLLKMGILK